MAHPDPVREPEVALRAGEAHRSATRALVASGSELSRSYLLMNAAATLIAGFGLLENSTAVIIGAMLIATLFGPIVGIALGLAEGDLRLLIRSLLAELAGVACVLALGYGVGLAGRGLSIGSEILTRASPGLLDLLIALVGGIAGAYTFVTPGLGGVIVGVAIATALVPPLTSCGILLAHHELYRATGAFLLFVANFGAIAIGAMVVFWLAGHRPRASGMTRGILVPRLISLLLLAALAVHFALTFRQTIARSLVENGIRTTLTRDVAKLPGAWLQSVTISPRGVPTAAWAVVRTPKPIGPAEVGRLNDAVDRAARVTVELHVRSVITAETTRQGYVYHAELSPTDDPGP